MPQIPKRYEKKKKMILHGCSPSMEKVRVTILSVVVVLPPGSKPGVFCVHAMHNFLQKDQIG